MRTSKLSLFAGLLAGFLIANNASAQWAADLVLGQSSFTTRAPDAGPGPGLPLSFTSLNGPGGVAVSPVSGKVFIADYFNNRVTRYPSAASLTNGTGAEDFVPLGNGGAWSIFVDANDTLWVADYGRGLITTYRSATSRSLNLAPDSTFTVSGCQYIWVDAKDNLWVTYGSTSPTITWLAKASSFSGAVPAVNWTGTMKFTNKPQLGGIAVGITGNKVTLWVADANNNCVYGFNNPKNGQGQKKASVVLGQPTLTSTGPKSGPAGLSYPRSLFLDAKGRLWVADTADDKASKAADRVLRWDKTATIRTGANASAIIGQSDFFKKKTGVTAKLIAPFRGGVWVDGTGAIWFADDFNNRVLHYTPERVKPKLGIRGFKATSTTKSRTAAVSGKASDASGVALVQYSINGKPFVAAKGTTKWKFTAAYVKGANSVKVQAVDTQGNKTTLRYSVTVTK